MKINVLLNNVIISLFKWHWYLKSLLYSKSMSTSVTTPVSSQALLFSMGYNVGSRVSGTPYNIVLDQVNIIC